MLRFIKIIILLQYLITNQAFSLENKIILKINNNPVTSIDILSEIEYLKFFNEGFENISDEEMYQIAIQSLIKHETKKDEIIRRFQTVEIENEEYLNLLIKNKYQNLGLKNLNDLHNSMQQINLDSSYLKEKLTVDIKWNQLIFSIYNQKVNINENELKRQILNQTKYTKLYHLKEIVFEASSVDKIDLQYTKILNDIKILGFSNAALKYSISDTSTNGGDLGWVDEKLINKVILKELENLEDEGISKPIRISTGFLILKKDNVKKEEKKIDIDKELENLIKFEMDRQLQSYSKLYFNKVKNNIKIDVQ